MNRIRPASASDIAAIRDLLQQEGLPTADLSHSAIAFWVSGVDTVQAAIGLETHGDTGLLRSMVVAPALRRSGEGQRLLHFLEQEAERRHLRSLYLLTLTAEDFFRSHGYQVIERSQVPEPLLQSQEFRSLCRASAVCMVKPVLPT